MKRLILGVVAAGALLGSCGFPPNDGQVHVGTATSVVRHTHNDVETQVCPPLCGPSKGDSK